MNEKQLVEYALEAGFRKDNQGLYHPEMPQVISLNSMLMDFAKLVLRIEREACAKVVEQAGMYGYGTLAAAELIRKRSG